MPAKITTIDEYLAGVSAEQRTALEKLRRTIQSAAPHAEECISYGLAAFRLDGKPLVGFGASASHCAFYLMSGSMVEAHQEMLKNYDTSKGTIRFGVDRPLPAALVKKLVKARIAENAALRDGAKPSRPAAKKKVATTPSESRTDPAVDTYLRELKHARKDEIESLRQLILGVSPEIREGIKWNSPSFRTTDDFATLHLRKDQLSLVLHTGAKVKETATNGVPIADSAGVLKWLAKDRAIVTFTDAADFAAKRDALAAILREWMRWV